MSPSVTAWRAVGPGAAVVGLLLAACATTGGGGVAQPADRRRPDLPAFEDAQRAMLRDAYEHARLADEARASGNLDQARAEDRAAADGFARFVETFPSSEWRLVFERVAAERYLLGGKPEAAAAQARKILDDPRAGEPSKAVAARLLAAAWQSAAAAAARDGAIEPLRLLTAAQRKGQELRPRIPPEPWKRFVEAADLYQRLAPQDPAQRLPPEERAAAGVADPGDLALLAAEVEFSFDNLEDARQRLDRIVQTWPGDSDRLAVAVPLYLETFLLLRDDAGFEGAVGRLRPTVRASAREAAEAARAPGAAPEQARRAAVLSKLEEQLDYMAAGQLLAAGRFAEAAAGFEAFAAANRASPDAAGALFNAALAWDRAKDPRRANALREQLLREYPEAKVAPQATLSLAASRAREGDHAGAVRLYDRYLQKWPKGPQRCLARFNVGVEVESLGNRLEAAQRYRTFASDKACIAEDPNGAVTTLTHAADLFRRSGRRSDAVEMWKIVATLPGVTDAAAREKVEEAKRLLDQAR